MNILDNVYHQMIWECPSVPPESGGIIGGTKHIVSMCKFDVGKEHSRPDQYFPDVNKLNDTIHFWREQGIEFYGIFHSHFPEGVKLSGGDQRYIEAIMLALPVFVPTLFFPIVFPKNTMIAYRADKYNGLVQIVRDEIRIL